MWSSCKHNNISNTFKLNMGKNIGKHWLIYTSNLTAISVSYAVNTVAVWCWTRILRLFKFIIFWKENNGCVEPWWGKCWVGWWFSVSTLFALLLWVVVLITAALKNQFHWNSPNVLLVKCLFKLKSNIEGDNDFRIRGQMDVPRGCQCAALVTTTPAVSKWNQRSKVKVWRDGSW